MAGKSKLDSKIGGMKPSRKDIQKFVIPKVSTHYNEIGIELFRDEDLPILDEIRASNPNDYRKACSAMFQHWLEKGYPDASWSALIAALKSPGIQLIAASCELEKQLTAEFQSTEKDAPKASGNDDILDEKPKMHKLQKIVTPNIKHEWKNVAYSMEYELSDVKAIEQESQNDLAVCCQKLFENWLSTNHYPKPHTWRKLLERIKDVDNLQSAAEKIEEKLLEK